MMINCQVSSRQKIRARLLLPLVFFFKQRIFCAFVWKWLALIARPNILTGLNIKLLFIPCTISPDTGTGMALINRNVGVAPDLFLVFFQPRTKETSDTAASAGAIMGPAQSVLPSAPPLPLKLARALLWFPPTSVRRSYPISPGRLPNETDD